MCRSGEKTNIYAFPMQEVPKHVNIQNIGHFILTPLNSKTPSIPNTRHAERWKRMQDGHEEGGVMNDTPCRKRISTY